MKNKKKIISLTAMSLVLGSTIATANAADSFRNGLGKIAGISREGRQAEMQALENGDFAAWKIAVESSGHTEILSTINEGNFARYAEAFNLEKNGDREGAQSIMRELGIKMPERGDGGAMRKIDASEEDREALELAVENSDYDAWRVVMEKVKNDDIEQYLTEENFNIIVRAYKLRASGDRSGAMDLLDGSDIPGFLMMLCEDKPEGGRGEADETRRAAIEATYESGDYEAWKALMEERGGKILEYVTADNFAEYAHAKLLQEDGQMDEAKTILDELGFPFQERGQRRMGAVPATAMAD